MGSVQRDESPGLAVEVAKLRLRVAAEKAEPARLLRQQVGTAPLGSATAAAVVGLLMGRTAKGATGASGARHVAASLGVSVGSVLGPTLAALVSSLVAGAAAEWRRR